MFLVNIHFIYLLMPGCHLPSSKEARERESHMKASTLTRTIRTNQKEGVRIAAIFTRKVMAIFSTPSRYHSPPMCFILSSLRRLLRHCLWQWLHTAAGAGPLILTEVNAKNVGCLTSLFWGYINSSPAAPLKAEVQKYFPALLLFIAFDWGDGQGVRACHRGILLPLIYTSLLHVELNLSHFLCCCGKSRFIHLNLLLSWLISLLFLRTVAADLS